MQQIKIAIAAIVLCAMSSVAQAGMFTNMGGDMWRPCGPGNSCGGNTCIPQGFYGADFRHACANHDANLQSCMSRKCADRQFLSDMNDACSCSSNPRACQRKAQHYYRTARMFGWMY